MIANPKVHPVLLSRPVSRGNNVGHDAGSGHYILHMQLCSTLEKGATYTDGRDTSDVRFSVGPSSPSSLRPFRAIS